MDFIIDKDTQIYNINISNSCEYSYFDEQQKKWRNTKKIGIYITINKIVTTFIPFYYKDHLERIPSYKTNFENTLNGKNINYLNNDYSLEKNMFELSTINQILNMEIIKIINIDDLTEFYNKMELLGYIKILYEYQNDRQYRFPIKTKNIAAFYYTELFINKIMNYYSIHKIIKFNNNTRFDMNDILELYDNTYGALLKTDKLNNNTHEYNYNHNVNIVVIQSKISKKSISFYNNIDEFLKERLLDKKYKIHQLEPLLIEELPDAITNPINLLDLSVDDKTKNIVT